jgi:hypothetical protein
MRTSMGDPGVQTLLKEVMQEVNKAFDPNDALKELYLCLEPEFLKKVTYVEKETGV